MCADTPENTPKQELCVMQRHEFMFRCMLTNLEHARHVENERMMFMSLTLVGMATILGASVATQCAFVTCGTYLVLCGLNCICGRLLKR
jgi:hypothetical protein